MRPATKTPLVLGTEWAVGLVECVSIMVANKSPREKKASGKPKEASQGPGPSSLMAGGVSHAGHSSLQPWPCMGISKVRSETTAAGCLRECCPGGGRACLPSLGSKPVHLGFQTINFPNLQNDQLLRKNN